ncbi:hypothetical protein FHX42_004824 [Saccharopolyspora lacisalsi]|uniref:Uncharacterized protein n=1 Tax=Halosaccharopolyspora lacisalsi TaxID=1000566 RepID=A0A839E9B2_9PSEU|nr:hypothetical protein [Halosaccharopolyspora lacisalsi]MBA8827428.1 hypothetical protein [Halosaccharopolyspora lacisalsi]
MRTSLRVLGVATATVGLFAMGSPAFAANPPSVDVEDVTGQIAQNEGGNAGNGGEGGTGVNLCGLVPIAILGENTVNCSAGNGGDGGAGGEAGSEQQIGGDKDKKSHK